MIDADGDDVPRSRTVRKRSVSPMLTEVKRPRQSGRLCLEPIEGDGNCLFRAIARLHYGTQDDHSLVRAECCEQLAKHAERYRGFCLDNFSEHVSSMRQQGVWGGEVEIAALSDLYQVDIVVFAQGRESHTEIYPLARRFPAVPPLALSYDGGLASRIGSHYQCLVPCEE